MKIKNNTPPKLTKFVPMPPVKPAKKKTNKDWLLSLSNKDLTMLMLGRITDFSRQSTSSQNFIEEWLEAEYDEVYAKIAFPYLRCWWDN